jgi:pyruvate/2-oxoglutarate dehydrogenase complex dihydrolipoamide acyltransferase (E2) component
VSDVAAMRRPIVISPIEWGAEPVRLIHWLVVPGEEVAEGEILAEVGRPGIIGDIRASYSGRVSELCQIEADGVLPGAVLGWLDVPPESETPS